MNRKNDKTIILLIGYSITTLIAFHIGVLLAEGYRVNSEFNTLLITSLKTRLIVIPQNKEEFIPFWYMSIMYFAFSVHTLNRHFKFMTGKEYGTSEWGEVKDILNYKDKKNIEDNIILAEKLEVALNSDINDRNLNCLIVGASGTGKSRFWIKPNLLQLHSSYVITDPKGELLADTGNMFINNGYKLKVLNLVDMNKSFKFNPFNYIKNEVDIQKVIDNILLNINKDKKGGDPFWDNAQRSLLQALFHFVFLVLDKEEKNIASVIRLIEKISVDENKTCEMTIIMEHINKILPNQFFYKQWLAFKKNQGKTLASVVTTTINSLSIFNIPAVEELTSKDEFNFSEMANQKTVIFVIMSDSNNTFEFLTAIFFQQLLETLYLVAGEQKALTGDEKLKVPIRLMLDEFANIGKIPRFEQFLSTMRSRGISANVILQNLAQLKSMYKDDWQTIIGNCDSFIFLGGMERETNKTISEMLGKQTIDTKSRGRTFSKSNSNNTNWQKGGRDLLTSDELGRLDNKLSIVMFRGLQPFKAKKYDIKNHRNYYQLGGERGIGGLEKIKKRIYCYIVEEDYFKIYEKDKNFKINNYFTNLKQIELEKIKIQKRIDEMKNKREENSKKVIKEDLEEMINTREKINFDKEN